MDLWHDQHNGEAGEVPQKPTVRVYKIRYKYIYAAYMQYSFINVENIFLETNKRLGPYS